MKKRWAEDEAFRKSVLDGQTKFMEISGYWPGTDPKSCEKGHKTYFERTGYDHNWKNPISRRKAQKTCLKKYGKHSWEIALSKLPKTNTRIEQKIAKILQANNVIFIQQYRIYFKGRKFKQYDFYLPELKTLIEADGDYWHANPKIYSTLNEVQTENSKNDVFKTNLAKKNDLNLKRFWENDILKNDFEVKLLGEIIND